MYIYHSINLYAYMHSVASHPKRRAPYAACTCMYIYQIINLYAYMHSVASHPKRRAPYAATTPPSARAIVSANTCA